jgi:lysophospholipase L1-like esterase
VQLIRGAVLAAALLNAATAFAQPAAAPPPTAPPTGPAAAPGRGPPPGPPIPTTQPRPRDDARHQAFLIRAQEGNIDLLFVGDSITDWWRTENRGKPEWDKSFASLRAENWGIAGDTTQGVLWRMQNGELDGFKAKLIVLMLGTNNLSRATPAEIAAGDAMIIREFRQRQPQAKILVLGVFPRGAAPDSPYRAQIKELNYHLSHVADGNDVFYMDIGDRFLAPDGTLTREVMADGLHPTLRGYEIWAAAIGPKVAELMSAADSPELQRVSHR